LRGFLADRPQAVTALAVGNVGRQRDATTSHHLPPGEGRGEGAPNHDKPCSHDTSRIAWAKLMARVGEEFPLERPWVRRRHPAQRDGRQEDLPVIDIRSL